MAWTTPKTWSVSELLTAANLNTHLRDNLNALKAPPSDAILRDNGASYSTTSTTFVSVDGTNLVCTVTTAGGDVVVFFCGTFHGDASGRKISLDILIDGTTRHAADYNGGLVTESSQSSYGSNVITLVALISGLSAGEHTFALQWKTDAGTIYLHSDSAAGSVLEEVPVVFIAREMS